MNTVFNNGFKMIDNDILKYLTNIRNDLYPLFYRYAGMGYYYIFIENLNLHSNKRFVILRVGGPNGYDSNISEEEYKKYNGNFYTIDECEKYCRNLILP